MTKKWSFSTINQFFTQPHILWHKINMKLSCFENHWTNPKTDVVDPNQTKNWQNAPSFSVLMHTTAWILIYFHYNWNWLSLVHFCPPKTKQEKMTNADQPINMNLTFLRYMKPIPCCVEDFKFSDMILGSDFC